MLYEQLKKNIIYQLLAGIVFSSLLFTAIVLNKYEDSIPDEISRNRVMKTKIVRIKQARAHMESEIKYMQSQIKYVEGLLLTDFITDSAPEDFIFMGLDDIKTKLPPWSELKTGDIEEKEREINISVEIVMPVYDYTALLNYIGYLESLKFPYYTIERINIKKLPEEPGDVICNIKGILRMPILPKEGIVKQ